MASTTRGVGGGSHAKHVKRASAADTKRPSRVLDHHDDARTGGAVDPEAEMNKAASNLKAKHVLILGLGESGLAMARWCAREGASVRVADTRVQPPMLAALRSALPDAEVRFGAFTADLLDGIDLIAISPGLALTAEPQRALLDAAHERTLPVAGEIELFAQKLLQLKSERGYAPRIVAITGTNGKTTVTSLLGKCCARAGVTVCVAGNIGPAALAALADALDAEAAGTPLPAGWVLELSSFQLATTQSLVPDVATVLNITQDHLDWHGDLEAYAAAKARIFGPHTVRVLNRDDPRVMRMADASARVVTFGLDAPESSGSFGVVVEGEAAHPTRWLAMAEELSIDITATPSRKIKKAAGPRGETCAVKRLMPADALRVRGDHNLANALAALALGRALGLTMAAMLHALAEYRGQAHRVEFVARIGDIDYIEDSKGTNVGATVAALTGLGQKLVLIAGGDGKGQDFSPLAAPVARHARGVVLIGKDRAALRAALSATGVPLVECASLEDAVREASRMAESGDAVLLSPACASLDMFRDYKHRAAVFVDAVQRMAEAASQPC